MNHFNYLEPIPGSVDGGRRLIIIEPPKLVITRFYEIQWGQKRFDYARLAHLRVVEKWNLGRLADHYKVSQETIQRYLRRAEDRKEIARG